MRPRALSKRAGAFVFSTLVQFGRVSGRTMLCQTGAMKKKRSILAVSITMVVLSGLAGIAFGLEQWLVYPELSENQLQLLVQNKQLESVTFWERPGGNDGWQPEFRVHVKNLSKEYWAKVPKGSHAFIKNLISDGIDIRVTYHYPR